MGVRTLINGGLTPKFRTAGESSLGGDNAVSPAGLCFVQSHVSLFDDASPIAVEPGIDWIGCYPAADRDTHLLFRFFATKLLLLDAPPHALGGSHGAMKILTTQEKQNFFSAVTESGVAVAQTLPNRPTACFFSASAISLRTWSPFWCPYLSLCSLKWSTSHMTRP